MRELEPILDAEIAQTIMPEEYKDKYMTILCNDCQEKSNVKFHIVGGKCNYCRSYNTSRLADDPNVPRAD